MSTKLLDAARAFYDAGCAVIPAKNDGSKAPFGQWKRYQETRPTWEQIEAWLASPSAQGIGVICGRASGDLEMIEFERRAINEGLLVKAGKLMGDNGMGDLWTRITLYGYTEASPSGGIHLHYRVDGKVRPNTALAKTADEAVLIETRGEGGFTITAPSGGSTHPSGETWESLTGNPRHIPMITTEEYDALWLILGMLDQRPVVAPQGVPTEHSGPHGSADGSVRPGDDFALRHTWDELLQGRGWTFVRQIGEEKCWRRPGKKNGGISATTGRGGLDNLWNFSSNADLPTGQPVSKLYAYACWFHGGDIRAAVRDLASQGYGSVAPAPTLRLVHSEPPGGPQAAGTVGGIPLRSVTAPDPENGSEGATEGSLSDDGNARLLQRVYGDKLSHADGIGWCWWDGKHWVRDAGKPAMEAMKDTIHDIIPGASQAIARHKAKSLNHASLKAALAVAASMPEFSIEAAVLDARGSEINTPGGTVDLITGELLKADPLAYHTKTTRVAPARMPTPLFDKFLAETFDGVPEMIGYTQRLVGYSASGSQNDHVLPFLLGGGQNGKSVFTGVIRKLLDDYAIVASPGFLMAGRSASDSELARLHGARLVLCAEVNPRDRFDEQRIKMLTGGDAITGRNLYQKHFTFEATQHLWLMGNHQPQVDAGGDSFWRRLRLVPFPNRVADDKRVKGLTEILVDREGPGILQWIIDGAVAYFRDGLEDPESVTAATQQYAQEEDALGRFLAENCRITPHAAEHIRVDTGKVREAYMEWCHREGERPLAPPHFGRELRSRFGVTTQPSNGHRYYLGMSLTGGPDLDGERKRWGD